MKINNLMIDDWVKLVADDTEEFLQVNYVRRDGVGFKKYSHFFDEIEPIPLTEEILVKNGFWRGCYVKYFQHKFLNNLGIDIGENVHLDHFIDDLILEVRYVHELQHALRLCGLNDLADNFKI